MPNDSANKTIPIDVLEKVIDAIPYGVAIYNKQGHYLTENKAFSTLGSLRPKFHFDDITDITYLPIAFNRTQDTPGWATVQQLDENLALVTINASNNVLSNDIKAFQLMMEAHGNGYDLYRAGAIAIGLSLGWRWVGITRLIESDNSVEVLGFWDTSKLTEVFSFELAKTPCEKVFNTENICEFSQVCDLFPEDQMLIDIGAVSYAGKVYKIGNQQHGHIFIMDDKPRIITPEVETILSSFAEYIGSRLEVFHHIQRNIHVNELANTDKLTGLGNRLALEGAIKNCQNAHLAGKLNDVLIVFIDLDGMKAINDQFGHEQGDLMLQTFSSNLSSNCRANDMVFRLGGDEFVWLLKNSNGNVTAPQIKDRIENMMKAVRESGFPSVGASMGIANLAENNWDFEAALREADINMYANKRAKKLQRVS